ncbi:MAG: type IV toxin-antitoxin system AbiEi family antitoxin domain-containing protein [Smithella sp.]
MKRATVNWRIYNLVQQGLLKRIGRGIYSLGKGICFLPVLDKKQKSIFSQIKKKFPLITLCCWHTSSLKEFFQHVSMYDFLLVEVEREVIDSVFHFVKEINQEKYTFKEPLHEMMGMFVLESKGSIIVKSLTSEAPLQDVDHITVPAIEKILVDLYADSDIFSFLQGSEMLNIFESALGKYTVNTNRLLRYAKRRNKEKDIRNILAQISGK